MITDISQVSEFPLTWPDNKQRVGQRQRAPFYNTTLAKSLREIGDEMRRYRARSFVVSMAPAYRRTDSDPAVAVWFEIVGRDQGLAQLRVIACDKYFSQEDNAHAIALTLQGLRAFERYGTYTQEQALEGARLALPGPENGLSWQAVLGHLPQGVVGDDAIAIMNARYRRMAADAANDEAELRRLNLAIEKARAELNGGAI